MPTVTVKMNAHQFACLGRLARERQLPKAQVLREAFEGANIDREGARSKLSAFDLAVHLAGTVDGPRDASTSRKYLADFGRQRKRARRKKVNDQALPR